MHALLVALSRWTYVADLVAWRETEIDRLEARNKEGDSPYEADGTYAVEMPSLGVGECGVHRWYDKCFSSVRGKCSFFVAYKPYLYEYGHDESDIDHDELVE